MEGKSICAFLLVCICWLPCSSEVSLNVQPYSTTSTTGIGSKENNVVDAINSFGYKLMLKMMKEQPYDNIAISPTGIAGLLAMTLLGAIGKTYDEIVPKLGFSQDVLVNRKNHEYFGELLNQLNANNLSKTLYADAIFVDGNTRVRQLYRNYLNKVYRGEALSADFTATEETRNNINEWVNNHTEGKIDNFLKQPLPAATKVVLLCALYFGGQWAQPFQPEYTAKMPFTTPKNFVMANLMANFGEFDYIFSEQEGLHVIALPYNDSITTMYALKPLFPKRTTLTQLMERLNYEKIDEIISQMVKKKCVLRFPKMELASSLNLRNTLSSLGIQSMFVPSEANFAFMVDGDAINKTEVEITARINSGVSEARGIQDIINRLPNPGIHVDSILHDVKITIDEYGTEAAAATAAVLARSSEQFYADSPFYIFIRNEKTKLVTFSAVINDPTI